MRTILLTMIGLSVGLMADFSKDNTTEVVTDNLTGLQWQDNAEAKNNYKKWTEAIDYCESLTLGGYSDWRLPNFNELNSITDKTHSLPAVDSVFQNVCSGDGYSGYWSSTTIVGNEDHVWNVEFNAGLVYGGYKYHSYCVRCVRAGQ